MLDEPLASFLNHVIVDIDERACVIQKAKSIRSECKIRFAAAPIGEPAAFAAMVEQSFVARLQVEPCTRRSGGNIFTSTAVVTQNHQAGVTRRDSLLGAPVRPLHYGFNAFDHVS